jgi:hypothetical protein
MDHLRELLSLAEPLDVTQTLTRCLNMVFTLQGLRYNTVVVIGQHLEASRRDWQQLSAAHQQLNFTLTQMQQENDRLRARRFQLEERRLPAEDCRSGGGESHLGGECRCV